MFAWREFLHNGVFLGLGVCGALLSTQALAKDREVGNPRILGEGIMPQSMFPSFARQLPHERVLDLKIVYTDGEIYNPTTGTNDKVRLRSYNGTDVDPSVPYVSPTIEAAPGDTIRVNLHNELPFDVTCSATHTIHNEPHCFNGTNLHTHGLWVSPAGNGDNVLLSINPGTTFEYIYNIPGDHPAGTFWYHTHRHGSTALQVASGMAGALIVRGGRLPTKASPGDLDTLLASFPERVIVFQQIQYACREPGENGKLGPIKTNPDGTYRCDARDVGAIEGYDQFGPGSWPASGRYTSLNGVVLPTIHAQVGRIERWRMIHGGVRDTISLKLVRMTETASLPATLSEASTRVFIDTACTGKSIPFHLVAADGLTMAAGQKTEVATFQPGYRFDGLMGFPEAGKYCLLDASAPAVGSVNGDTPGPALLGIVSADPGEAVSDISEHLKDALVKEAEKTYSPVIGSTIIADLKDGLKLTSFIQHSDIAPNEVTGHQELTFYIDTSTTPPVFEVSNTHDPADAEPYNPDRMDRRLELGSVDEWTIRSAFASHPFHIHINPFQIVSILDPAGRDVSVPGAIDSATGGDPDPQYPGLKGVWKDTLWIKSLLPGDNSDGLYTVTVRSRYQRYIGKFVLHCHILDHEDQGMMQNVEIVLPAGHERPSPVHTKELHKHL